MTVASHVRKVSSGVHVSTKVPLGYNFPKLFTLRDYQEDAIKSVLGAADRNVKRPAVVLATGGGKTVVMSALIPQLQAMENTRIKTLVLAHKEELVKQACNTISKLNPQLKVQIDMLRSKPDEDADVIVGSVYTLVRMTRLERYKPLEYKMIVLDECHHSTAVSWTKILNYFGALDAKLKIYVVGFTATMERSDGDSLGKVFQEIVFERSLLEMVEKKELCDVKFSALSTTLDLKEVSTRNGDYVEKQLTSAVNNDDINWQIVKGYLQLAKEHNFKSTLVFCVSIEHCMTLCGVLQENGVNAQYVTSKTVRHERLTILQDFKDGKIQVLCNVLVFTEGTDIPNIDSMILARPTKSKALLIQMIGRGLRLHHGKTHCHVIDMVGAGQLGYLSVPTLIGLEDDENKLKRKTLAEREKEENAVTSQMEANRRQKTVEEILRIQKLIEHIKLLFDTVDGFANFEHRTIEQFSSSEAVHKKFRESSIFWIRLEYDVWGALSEQKDGVYYTIRRMQLPLVADSETTAVQFELARHIPIPLKTLIASGFKSARTTENTLMTGELPNVIATAENMLRKGFKVSLESSITASQKALLVRGLKAKVHRNYGEEASEKFGEHVSKLTLNEASNLIFAMKFSVNSLWVKWALSKMYGPPPQHQARADREIKKLEKGLRRLKLEQGRNGIEQEMKQEERKEIQHDLKEENLQGPVESQGNLFVTAKAAKVSQPTDSNSLHTHNIY